MELDQISKSHREALAALSADSGEMWKEVQGEMHSDYGEVIFWILLFDDSDVTIAHQRFVAIAEPFADALKPMEMGVYYYKLTEDEIVHVERLKGTEKVLAAKGVLLGERSFSEARDRETVFEADDSTR